MKLYYSPGACSMTPHIVLREAGYSFELEKVDIPAKKTEKGTDYWTINPKGYVPALRLDDGQVLTEVGVIAQYLADHKPEAGLAPKAGSIERYRLMEWLNFIATEVHKQIGALFNPQMTPEMKQVQLGYITRRLNTLNQMMDGRPFLMGERFSVADAYLYNMVRWTAIHKIDIAPWPAIRAHFERVGARPKVQEVLKAEGLAK